MIIRIIIYIVSFSSLPNPDQNVSLTRTETLFCSLQSHPAPGTVPNTQCAKTNKQIC